MSKLEEEVALFVAMVEEELLRRPPQTAVFKFATVWAGRFKRALEQDKLRIRTRSHDLPEDPDARASGDSILVSVYI